MEPAPMVGTINAPQRIFDGHNDVLLRLMNDGAAAGPQRFLAGEECGHIDLPRARAGGLAGGLFAIFPPPLSTAHPAVDRSRTPYDTPLPPELALEAAQSSTFAMASILLRLANGAPDDFALCLSAGEVAAAMDRGAMAAVFHIEGAEAIDAEFHALDVLYAAGLRSLGLVWSRPNRFGHGVPFRFPSSPDTGPGLSDLGRELVRRCNALRILIDLSHLNEAGFRDVAALSTAPLVATHSNVHALSPHARNLTDWQLGAIRDSGGVVGLNFATGFLRADGLMRADTAIDDMLRHLDALLERLGEDGVALGSDFDGALIPAAIGDASGLPHLVAAMAGHGYGADLIERIAWRNWLRLLEKTIG